MKSKLAYMFIGMLLILALALIVDSALAGPKQCPPGQHGNCNTYIQKVTGNYGCFPASADPQGWTFVKTGCDEDAPEVVPSLTPVPLFPPPATPVPFFPSPTIPPDSIVTAIPTKWQKSNPVIPTATAYLVDSGSCPNNCLCLLVTQAVIANDLQKTQIAIDMLACNRP